jgi:hypothetical protein
MKQEKLIWDDEETEEIKRTTYLVGKYGNSIEFWHSNIPNGEKWCSQPICNYSYEDIRFKLHFDNDF